MGSSDTTPASYSGGGGLYRDPHDPYRGYGSAQGGRVQQAASGAAGTASSAASSVSDAASSAASTVSDAASSAAAAVQDAPQVARRQAQGNPLAAGLIAFGAGWLVSSLAPASRAEQGQGHRAGPAAG